MKIGTVVARTPGEFSLSNDVNGSTVPGSPLRNRFGSWPAMASIVSLPHWSPASPAAATPVGVRTVLRSMSGYAAWKPAAAMKM